jgi:hypothetical protein
MCLSFYWLLPASPVWREREQLLQSARSVPGVGPLRALTRLADLPELGALMYITHKPGAALAASPHQPRQRHPAGQTPDLGGVAGCARPCP